MIPHGLTHSIQRTIRRAWAPRLRTQSSTLWRAALPLFAFGALLTARSAEAQRTGGQRFVPANSPDGVFATEGATVRPSLNPYIALWAHYALDPVVAEGVAGEESALVEHVMATDLVASMAVWKGLSFGLGVPVSWVRQGDGDANGALGLADQTGVALGDLVLRGAYRFQLSYATALAIHVPVFLPTAQQDNLLSLGFGAQPTLALTQRWRRVHLLANAFFLARQQVDAPGYRGGHEVGLKVALRGILGRRQRGGLLAELSMATATRSFFGEEETPTEARVGGEYKFAKSWRATLGAGTGIGRGVGAPDVRALGAIAFAPEQGKPRPARGDRDGDGIPDKEDRCPWRVEDVDGFEDDDGCPDVDNDGDGIVDEDDECPIEPEDVNGIADEDGCPDFVRIEEGEIVTFEPLYFGRDSRSVDDRSKPMLNEIAHILKANRNMSLRIEGHADATGQAKYNLRLSRQRATVVRDYLLTQGIERQRLRVVGYGEARPHASNSSRSGRARNRRVEFHIELQGGKR